MAGTATKPAEKSSPLFRAGELPRQLRERGEALHEKLAAAEAALQEVQRQREVMQESELNDALVDRAKKLNAREVELLKQQQRILFELDDFFPTYAEAITALPRQKTEQEIAYERFEAAKADVVKKLVNIGYVDTDDMQTIGRITPGMLLAHPVVAAERMQHDAISARMQGSDVAGVGPNPFPAMALEVNQKLDAIKQRLFATV